MIVRKPLNQTNCLKDGARTPAQRDRLVQQMMGDTQDFMEERGELLPGEIPVQDKVRALLARMGFYSRKAG